MFCDLPSAGETNEELARQVHPWWLAAAAKADVDVTGFDPEAPVAQRVAWAKRVGLSIATIYSRFSSKRQHSTADQVRTCVQFAVQNGMYVSPELVSINEGVKGQRIRRDGMSVKEGWRRWVGADGPSDPRSPLAHAGYRAYRRMLSNARYVGRWEFGRKRNQFSSKRDYVRQIEQPESEIEVRQCEALRIVDDELFYTVQERLRELPPGPRRPRKARPVRFWDITTALFRCAGCGERFYKAGAHGQAMQCKRAGLCPCKAHVNSERAVRAVCQKLAELIGADEKLICDVVCYAEKIDARGEEELQGEISAVETKIRMLSNRIGDLMDLAGQGTEEDRRELKAKIRSAQSERSGLQLELTRLRKAAEKSVATITPDDVRRILGEFAALVENAASGALGDDAVYKALSVFRQLVGGSIEVHVEPRLGRKRAVVRGKFRPRLMQAVRASAGLPHDDGDDAGEEVVVWLREPPRMDRYAEQVRQLYEEEGLAFRVIGERLGIGCAGAWQAYRRHYQMIGQPAPPRRPASGHQRHSA